MNEDNKEQLDELFKETEGLKELYEQIDKLTFEEKIKLIIELNNIK